MANTTCLVVTCSKGDHGLESLAAATSMEFKLTTNGRKSGGYVTLIETYAFSQRTAGSPEILRVIEHFLQTEFEYPELASITVMDDDYDELGGVVPRLPTYIQVTERDTNIYKDSLDHARKTIDNLITLVEAGDIEALGFAAFQARDILPKGYINHD